MEAGLYGRIHSIESFGLVDGPGVRFVIFFQGCQMRCQFCQNPDTWRKNDPKAKIVTADELLEKAIRYKHYWGNSGGITVSGGEPLLQIDFLIDLFQKAKHYGIHTTLDTCGEPFTKKLTFFLKLQKLLSYTDLILLDIKHIDELAHKALTGSSNQSIILFAKYLSEIGQPTWIRHVLVPGKTTQVEYLKQLSEFVKTLDNVEKIEILPYHTMGKYKWEDLGIDYPLKDISSPTEEQIARAETILKITQDSNGKR
ncbi:pyruvate formate-lyase 1-activating enzyme [Enterococcus sp. AZ135]|uniref:pyruvate formate-lyase-activating protein n=1 Tax=unclassified Enterococcus TaxID=2608891 RepID=UPI003F2802AC